MKAIEVKKPGGLEHLTLTERSVSSPGPKQIQVRWKATSLNYHDYLIAVGTIPVKEGLIPMSDGAGEVTEIGAEVTKWKVGDHIMSLFFPDWINGKPNATNTAKLAGDNTDGFLIQTSCVDESAVTSIPLGYSLAEAAALPCAALTAWRGLMVEGRLQSGQSVLIEGTGGMSLFALQIAKAAGAKVYATSSSEEKAVRLREMGAEIVVNYHEDEKWGKTIAAITGGGVDHVLDIGGGSTISQSVEACIIGGHISAIGILGGGIKGQIHFPKLFFKHIKLQGIAVGSREMQEEMVASININKWKPVIDKSFSIEEAADAFHYQESGAHFGKIVIEY